MNAAAALPYAERGLALLPVDEEKRPRTAHGVYDASTDPATIRAWFRTWPDTGMGVRTGGPGRLLVVDVDRHAGGADGFQTWRALDLADAGEPFARTPRGGEHRYFTAPTPIGCGAGRIGPGVDHRGDGGYVVIPPSVNAYGPYTWQRSILEADPPPLPAALWDRLSQPPAQPTTDGGQWQPIVTLESAVDRLARAEQGERNQTLNLTAFLCGRLCAMGRVDEADALALLQDTACGIGLGVKETMRTLRSGFYDGLRARGCVPVEETRVAALQALQWGLGAAWPGRSGSANRRVYLALAATWLQTGGDVFGVDLRTLAERANIGHGTAGRAVHRLIRADLVDLVSVGGQVLPTVTGALVAASVYRVRKKSDNETLVHSTHETTPQASGDSRERTNLGAPGSGVASPTDTDTPEATVDECPTIGLLHAHDVFAWAGLGGRAAHVYGDLLAHGPATAATIQERTGVGRGTVFAVLKRLARLVDPISGELFPPLVVKEGECWRALPTDLDALAVFLRVDGRQARRKAQHARERESYTALCQQDAVKRELRERRRTGKRPKISDMERERFHRLYDATFAAHRRRRAGMTAAAHE